MFKFGLVWSAWIQYPLYSGHSVCTLWFGLVWRSRILRRPGKQGGFSYQKTRNTKTEVENYVLAVFMRRFGYSNMVFTVYVRAKCLPRRADGKRVQTASNSFCSQDSRFALNGTKRTHAIRTVLQDLSCGCRVEMSTGAKDAVSSNEKNHCNRKHMWSWPFNHLQASQL